jgi:multicomponent Na+:H+ antiporter subunit B
MARIRDNYERSAAYRAEKVIKGEAEPLDFLPEEDRTTEDKLTIEKTVKESESELSLSPETLTETVEFKLYSRIYKALSVVVCIIFITSLVITAIHLPSLGSDLNPANNEVPERYVEKGVEETGAINTVAGMILDYRAFDTFGESCVLFAAVICVLILLKESDLSAAEHSDRQNEPKNDGILKAAASILFPVIIIFGFYVILNGHLSAGGGFSGGAILGSGMILYLLAFGFEKAHKLFNYKTFAVTVCSAQIFYCIAKGFSFFTGANEIETHIPLGNPGDILSSGLILPLNICVGLVVAYTIYTFYVMFRRGGF